MQGDGWLGDEPVPERMQYAWVALPCARKELLMGLFKKQQTAPPVPVATELDQSWFIGWADDVQDRKGLQRSVDWVADHMGKCTAVIDHDCADYVRRYCDASTQRAYAAFVAQDPMPWELVSFVAGCPTTNGGAGWVDFIVSDVKSKVGRFGDILVDPSIVQ